MSWRTKLNIDINQDVVVRFDRDGRPLNYLGEIVPSQEDGSKRLWFSKECLEGLRRARKLVEE